MNKDHDASVSEHERKILDHYDSMTKSFYLQWNPDHFHLGLFEPGECPRHNESPKESEGLARALERMIDFVVAPAGVDASHHVVDAGCGVGGTAIHLARTRNCRVTGINLSKQHLEIADNKIHSAGLADLISLEYADCCRRLPFADASIDTVVSIESPRHYGDRRKFLQEAYRILKPGGKIVVSDWMVSESLTAAQYENYIRPLCHIWAMKNLERQSGYSRLLHEAGFKITEFEGFNGKEYDNLRILMHNYHSLILLILGGIRLPRIITLGKMTRSLCEVWLNGYLVIKRFCAMKAADGTSKSGHTSVCLELKPKL